MLLDSTQLFTTDEKQTILSKFFAKNVSSKKELISDGEKNYY